MTLSATYGKEKQAKIVCRWAPTDNFDEFAVLDYEVLTADFGLINCDLFWIIVYDFNQLCTIQKFLCEQFYDSQFVWNNDGKIIVIQKWTYFVNRDLKNPNSSL